MLAYFNGDYLPHQDVRIAPWDFGFTMGVTVTESMRTFAGRIPLVDRHLSRMSGGLSTLGVAFDPDATRKIVERLVAENWPLISDHSDLQISIALTPGQATHAAPEEFDCQVGPTQLVFTKELGFSKWANWYRDGLDLVPVEIEEISGKAIPRHIKCRSRLHYYLAEQNAKQISSQSRALLSSPEGGIAEATIAGIVMVNGEVMVAPPENAVLQSITFEVLKEIALEQGLSVERRAIDLDELKKADEVLWLNSSCCLAPVRSLAGESLGASRPVFQRLIQAWSKRFGVDLVRQATQLANSND